eukprot:22562-Pelagococcus_subviridis.AAC.12
MSHDRVEIPQLPFRELAVAVGVERARELERSPPSLRVHEIVQIHALVLQVHRVTEVVRGRPLVLLAPLVYHLLHYLHVDEVRRVRRDFPLQRRFAERVVQQIIRVRERLPEHVHFKRRRRSRFPPLPCSDLVLTSVVARRRVPGQIHLRSLCLGVKVVVAHVRA